MSPIIFAILLLVGHTVGQPGSESVKCEATTCCDMMTRMTNLLQAISYQLQKQTNDQEDLKKQLNTTRTSVLEQLAKQSEEIRSQSATCSAFKDQVSLVKSIYGAELGPRDCNDVKDMGFSQSGKYRIYPGSDDRRIETEVFCDLSSPNEAWLVFQRRKDGSVDFERTWVEYEKGFGDLNGEFWLGNKILSLLTTNRRYQLRIELEDFSGQKRYAVYSTFSVRPSTEQYKLTVAGYSGTAGDSFIAHNGMKFSTKDVDNDAWVNSCAQTYRGAWWYAACHASNLNGLYLKGSHTSFADGIEWQAWLGYYYSLKTTEMKITVVA